MPATTRTFVAVEVPDVVRHALGLLRARLEPEVPGARWVDPAQYHVTLAFLGDVPTDRLEAVAGAVAGAAAGHGPIALELTGLGAFPNPARPRILWAGLVGPGVAALEALQGAVAKALARAGTPGAGVDRFAAHVTLARFRERPGSPARRVDLGPLLREHGAWTAGAFEVAEVVTFASVLRPEGPSYSALARAALGGPRSTPSP